MPNCSKCGKELPKPWHTDICLECSREYMRKIFKKHPALKKTDDNTLKFMVALQRMREE